MASYDIESSTLESANYDLPVLVDKVSVEHSHAYSFIGLPILWLFLSSHDRGYTTHDA